MRYRCATNLKRNIHDEIASCILRRGLPQEAHVISYNKDGVRVWREYDIGQGKTIKWSELGVPKKITLPTMKVTANSASPKATFVEVSVRKRKASKSKGLRMTEPDSDSELEEQATNLFPCPNDGCIKSFQRFSSLQRHLDIGKHKYALEQETLLDKAMLSYAAKLDKGDAVLNDDRLVEQSTVSPRTLTYEVALPMGWALKSSTQQRKHFSDAQKKYLIKMFDVGEDTGHKVDANTVSISMRKARNLDAKKRREGKDTNSTDDEMEEDEEARVNAEALQQLTDHVINEVGLAHPIMFESHNLCELAADMKLSKFSIKMLTDALPKIADWFILTSPWKLRLQRMRYRCATNLKRNIHDEIASCILRRGLPQEAHVISYNKDGVRVWREYDIGQGKTIKWSELGVPKKITLPTMKVTANSASPKATFVEVSVRKRKASKSKGLRMTEPDSDSELEEQATNLFPCPNDGCIKSFQRFSSLQRHLDIGKHKYALEQETLLDKAMLSYAAKLDKGDAVLNDDRLVEQSTVSPRTLTYEVALPMGWALKSSTQQRKHFSDAQKKYLIKMFDVGEDTGHKVDANTVSISMRKARNLDGSSMFDSSDYLTPRQIKSFFSRLAKKRREGKDTNSTDDEMEEDEEARVNAEALQQLTNHVINEVGLAHPIMFESHNLCELAADMKLSKFSIKMLTDVCTFFELETSALRGRKQPYIDLLNQELICHCSCK
ncbi:hypothetical protein AC249_AIPGENE27447, partial [Exaiptasia diaphana]